VSLYIPFVFTFDIDTTEGKWKTFEMFIDTWFVFEIMTNFFTGFYLKGVLVLDLKRIALTYIKTWFVIDLLSSFPYSLLSINNDMNPSLLKAQ
jgi:hypothetical protein